MSRRDGQPSDGRSAGHLALCGANATFGLFPVFGLLAFGPDGFSPLGVGAWRIGAGAGALGVIAALRYGRRAVIAGADVPRFIACALLGVVINQGLFLVGLSQSTPLNAGIVMALIPIFTFSIAAMVGQEAFDMARAAGIVIALCGILPLFFGGSTGIQGSYTSGNLLMVCNALAYSGFLVLSKPLTRRYPSLVIIAWVYVLSLGALPLFTIGQQLVPPGGAERAWWSLAYILVFPTVVGYLLNTFALARVRASTTAVYVYTQPVITGLASWLVFAERPTPLMVLGAAALFFGIWLVAREPSGKRWFVPEESARSGS